MKKAKALHPVPKPKPRPKPAPRHPGRVAPPHSTGSASTLSAPPPGRHRTAHRARPGKPKRTAKPKKPKRKQPARKLSPGYDLACCSAEAVAMSLRLAGWPVTGDDVAGLYWLTADGPDDGASIEDTLDAALAQFPGVMNAASPGEFRSPTATAPIEIDRRAPMCFAPAECSTVEQWMAVGAVVPSGLHGLILGLALPEGPHAVLATPDGWWSWGELYDPGQFDGAVIEEAWAVTW